MKKSTYEQPLQRLRQCPPHHCPSLCKSPRAQAAGAARLAGFTVRAGAQCPQSGRLCVEFIIPCSFKNLKTADKHGTKTSFMPLLLTIAACENADDFRSCIMDPSEGCHARFSLRLDFGIGLEIATLEKCRFRFIRLEKTTQPLEKFLWRRVFCAKKNITGHITHSGIHMEQDMSLCKKSHEDKMFLAERTCLRMGQGTSCFKEHSLQHSLNLIHFPEFTVLAVV